MTFLGNNIHSEFSHLVYIDTLLTTYELEICIKITEFPEIEDCVKDGVKIYPLTEAETVPKESGKVVWRWSFYY